MGNQITKHNDTLAHLQGEHVDAIDLQQKMDWAKGAANLVAPTPSVGTIPEGFSVALAVVQVDTGEKSADVYDTGGGKLGLAKTPLQKIAGALGVSWDAQLSRRLDDGSDPRYCHYRAVGTVVQFDGTELQVMGDKEMDLREGSAQVEALWERYNAKLAKCRANNWKLPNEPTGQIREMRLHILSHAQTKAQLRAIRSLGVKTSYTAAELARPFVVARLHFTGRSSDPELQRRFSEMVAVKHLGGRRALYGGYESRTTPALTAPKPTGHAPPPVEEVAARESSAGFVPPVPPISDSKIVDSPPPTPRSSGQPERAQERTQQDPDQTQQSQRWQPPAQEQQTQPEGGSRAQSGFTIPYGNDRGKAIEDVDDRGLRWFAGTIKEKLNNGKADPRFRDKDEAMVAAIDAELAARGERF